MTASPLRRGPAFRAYLGQLLRFGVVEAGSRHDAVLKLVFWWHVAGKGEAQVRDELEAWARAHAHVSRLNGERFVRACVREGMHYHRQIQGLPQRARAVAATVTRMRALAPADFLVLARVRDDVRDEAHAILEYLAGHADHDGRVRRDVTLGRAQLEALVVRDRRIVDNGQRRRAEVIAVDELVRLGVLTLSVDYSTGHHGRIWSCWYQFGSGMLAMAREPGSYERSRARRKASADALVVAERPVRDGTLRVLTAGLREEPCVELEPAPGIVVEDTGGGRWWRDLFERRRFTVGEFFDADETVVVAGPWSRPPAATPLRYGSVVEELPTYTPTLGSYAPAAPTARETASAPVRDASGSGSAAPAGCDGRAALAAELEVDVEEVRAFDPELAEILVGAWKAHARRL